MKKYALLFILISVQLLIGLRSSAQLTTNALCCTGLSTLYTKPTISQSDALHQQAIQYYQQQLALAKKKGLALLIEKSYHDLAEAYANAGDYKRAYAYEQLRFAKHDSALHRSNSKSASARDILVSTPSHLEKTKAPLVSISTGRERYPWIWPTGQLSLGLIMVGLLFLLYRTKRRVKQMNHLFYQQTEMLVAQRDSIEEKSRKLEQLNITKDKFFSIVAHDLKGPINSLASFSNLLAYDLPRLTPQEVKVIAQELNKSVKNTSRLTENLLTWARLQMNNLKHYPSAVDINKIVEENLALFQTTAQQKQIYLYTETQSGLKVYADESQIRFILRNLIANALKFTLPEGRVQVTTQWENGRVKVSVQDNGVGISPEMEEKLFRIDAKHSTIGTAGEKGTGLGLVLCKEFAEQNGGQIHVNSVPGKGSIFTIYLQSIEENASVD